MGPQDTLLVNREQLEKNYDELIATPSLPSGMKSYYRCKDGSQLPFESTRHVLRSGEAWLIAAVSRDIRERIAKEQALRESEAGGRHAHDIGERGLLRTRAPGPVADWRPAPLGRGGRPPHHLPQTTRDF